MDDLECPRCGSSLRPFHCTGCGAAYREALGTPFIGDYEADDTLGLIEIAAQPRIAPHTAKAVREVDEHCAGFHAASDKDQYIRENPLAGAWWFSARYYEWVTAARLLDGIELKGSRVLDVGAGTGFDSYRLALRGAEVTGLEFNPILAEAGRQGFPELRWIGGFSHLLPFKTGSFDAVFFNASLHHMRDIQASLSEALRVLRPGGVLVTIGDSFRGDDQSIDFEYETYDRDKAVLLGINEQIPRFSDLVGILESNPDCVSVEIFTNWLHRHDGREDILDFTAWDLKKDGQVLRRSHGSMAMRIRLLKPWPHPRRLQTAGILPPATYVEWLSDQSEAVARLAGIVPAEHVDLPFPGRQTKFSLVNGWRRPTGRSSRTAYRRARWFLTRRGSDAMTFDMRAPMESSFTILINNKAVHQRRAGPTWTATSIGLSGLDAHAPFVVEIRRDDEEEDFDKACFEVRNRRFAGSGGFMSRFLPPSWRGRKR